MLLLSFRCQNQNVRSRSNPYLNGSQDNSYAICQQNFIGSIGMVQVYRNWEDAHCFHVVWRLKNYQINLYPLYSLGSSYIHCMHCIMLHQSFTCKDCRNTPIHHNAVQYKVLWRTLSVFCLGTRRAQLHQRSPASLLIASFSAELISSVREQGILALGQTCSQQAQVVLSSI